MPTIFTRRNKPVNATPQPLEKAPEAEPVRETPKEPAEIHPVTQPLSHAEQSVEKIIHSNNQHVGIFAAYALHPKGIKFANQEPDEVVLLFLRRHFITNIPWILATVVLFIAPLLLFTILVLFPALILPSGLTISLVAFYYLISISYAFGKLISWFYNIGVVTQKRIIDLDSHNILTHNTATASFGEIVDVKFKQQGFFQSTFDYGNIHIQTEAIHTNFEFDAAPKPTFVADLISDLRVAQHKGGQRGNS